MEIAQVEELVSERLQKEGLSQPQIDAVARQVLLSPGAKAAK